MAPEGIHLPAPPRTGRHRCRDSTSPGNFRLLVRLLTQMQRVFAINGLETLSVDVVETANLVIGQALMRGCPDPPCVPNN
jgi:hypothetical protein